jgi:hypothetical protein
MRGNHGRRPHGCGCAGIRAGGIATARAVNVDRPAVSCRGRVRDYKRSGIHGCSACLHVHRTPLKECSPVSYAHVLHGLHSGWSSAPEDVRFSCNVGQVFLARNSKNGIANRRSKRRSSAPADDAGTLLHVCAAAQNQSWNESKEAFHARCPSESARALQAKFAHSRRWQERGVRLKSGKPVANQLFLQ